MQIFTNLDSVQQLYNLTTFYSSGHALIQYKNMPCKYKLNTFTIIFLKTTHKTKLLLKIDLSNVEDLYYKHIVQNVVISLKHKILYFCGAVYTAFIQNRN